MAGASYGASWAAPTGPFDGGAPASEEPSLSLPVESCDPLAFRRRRKKIRKAIRATETTGTPMAAPRVPGEREMLLLLFGGVVPVGAKDRSPTPVLDAEPRVAEDIDPFAALAVPETCPRADVNVLSHVVVSVVVCTHADMTVE